jgi:hypothetical protein
MPAHKWELTHIQLQARAALRILNAAVIAEQSLPMMDDFAELKVSFANALGALANVNRVAQKIQDKENELK